jgi:hypothetical protein
LESILVTTCFIMSEHKTANKGIDFIGGGGAQISAAPGQRQAPIKAQGRPNGLEAKVGERQEVVQKRS